MKSGSTALKALLFDSGENTLPELNFADLYTITLIGGQIYRYTSGDGDLVYGGNTFKARDVQITRSNITQALGLEVSTLQLTISPGEGGVGQIERVPALQYIGEGGLDGALVRLERVFMPVGSYGDTSAGTVVLFVGRMGTVNSVGRTRAQMTVNSMLDLLNVQVPAAIVQPGCRFVLFDSGCTLAASAFQKTGAVEAGSNVKAIVTALSDPDGYYAQGTITFTSGINNGLSREIQSYVGGVITMVETLPETPSVGDTFAVLPGCDKTQATCSAKFDNLVHFGGFPYVPIPETII